MKRGLCLMCVISVFSMRLLAEAYTITKSANEYLALSFTSATKYFVTELKVVGQLNGEDFYFIREIASSKTNGNLTKLDLSEASFVDIDNITQYIRSAGRDKVFDTRGNHTHPVYKLEALITYHYYYYIGTTIITVGSGTKKVESVYHLDVNMIPNYAFYGCDMLKEVILPQSAPSIGTNSFSGCKSLESINIPQSLKTIGSYAFEGCSSLREIDLSQVTTVYDYSFSGCSSLTSIDLSNATYIGSYIFKDCEQLSSIVLSGELKKVSFAAFQNCKSLKAINLPQKMETVDTYAFWGCKLDSIVLPPATNSIGCNVFIGNPLRKVYCLATIPPVCDTEPFGNKSQLFVPKGCKEKYTLSPEWKKFKNIEEIPEGMFSSINSVQRRDIVTRVNNGILYISGLKNNELIILYDMSGKMIGKNIAFMGETNFYVGSANKVIIVKIANDYVKVSL